MVIVNIDVPSGLRIAPDDQILFVVVYGFGERTLFVSDAITVDHL